MTPEPLKDKSPEVKPTRERCMNNDHPITRSFQDPRTNQADYWIVEAVCRCHVCKHDWQEFYKLDYVDE